VETDLWHDGYLRSPHLKELQKENTELKKMLVESLPKNRVLEAVCEKSCEPGPLPGGGQELVKNEACSQLAAWHIRGWCVRRFGIADEPRRRKKNS
jgi:hypothetical protein